MKLLTLAGAYAGQIRDYDGPAGLAALRTGTAKRLDEPGAIGAVTPQASQPAVVTTTKRQPRRGTRT